MILDTLDNLAKYIPLCPALEQVVAYIKENDLAALTPGRHVIAGEDLFVNVQQSPAKGKAQARIETHRVMIDVQVPISADEGQGYTPACRLTPAPYDETHDMTFHPGEAETYFTVHQGEFVIYFPGEGHAPGISRGGLKKAIFKVKA